MQSPRELQPSPIGPKAPSVQSTQASPSIPQVVSVRRWQAPPAQQPIGQDSRVQLQVAVRSPVPVPMQTWPAMQGGLLPQRHSPVALQWLARWPHPMQAAPLVPHWLSVGGDTQVEPEQQPEAQLVALQAEVQMPDVQTPPVQVTQAPPPVPHAVLLVPVRQVVPSQQPEQELGSQTQAPPRHRWPEAQGMPLVPHAQAPPLVQRSDEVVLQEVQVTPGGAQAPALRVVQVWPVQQPDGQEVASQTHMPPLQR